MTVYLIMTYAQYEYEIVGIVVAKERARELARAHAPAAVYEAQLGGGEWLYDYDAHKPIYETARPDGAGTPVPSWGGRWIDDTGLPDEDVASHTRRFGPDDG